jgi:succinoglycan biosynthesis transport protein ExoP
MREKMVNYSQEDGAVGRGVNLREMWVVVSKRKWTIITFALIVFATVTIGSFLMKPTYTAKGTLMIEKEPNILTFGDIFQIEAFNDDYFQSQYKLLRSRTVAEITINSLKLYENENFLGRLKKDPISSDKDNPIFKEKLIQALLKRVAVKPIIMTRLVEVAFRDHDPKFAADTLNALFDAFIDMNIQKKYLATEQASEFLTKQITGVRAEIEESERKLGEYGAQKNIIVLSDKETTIIEKLGGLNRALTEAQIDRVKKESYYNEIKNFSTDYIPEAVNNPLIQNLREDYVKLSREYLKKQDRFKPDYPEMQRLKTELESARASLANETENLVRAAYADYQAALAKEKSLEEVFNNQKEEAVQLNSNAILYNSLKIEIENKKSLLESLLKRQSETDVSARLKNLRTSIVWIVDRAAIPLYPSSPKKILNMLLGLILGLSGGLGLAFLFERLDDSVKTFQDVEESTGLPALGIIPAFAPNGTKEVQGKEKLKLFEVKIKDEKKRKGKSDSSRWLLGETIAEKKAASEKRAAGRVEKAGGEITEIKLPKIKSIELITYFLPNSDISEHYRSVRTTLLLSALDSKRRYLAMSSALPEEGKTATISNLAVALAQAGKKVLLVDADLRKPKLHRIFKIANQDGLADYLTKTIPLIQLVKITQVPNLYLINAGLVPPNPVELLGSEKMTDLINTMKLYFEFILFDTPPLLTLSDTLVLGPKIDGVILVAWGGKTSRDALKRAKEKLDLHQIRCAGVIINNMSLEEHDYYFMQKYYRYYGKPIS